MLKESLLFAGGVIVGAAVIYGVYRYYQHHQEKRPVKVPESDIFAEKLKLKEKRSAKLAELISNQTYVEFLTSKELTSWFKENATQFGECVKMMIITPTGEHLGGLGYQMQSELDTNTNIIQLLFTDDENEGISVLKTRLINFTDIESNLQAHLIEQDGMLIVTI